MNTRREMLIGLGGILATGSAPAVLNNVPLCRIGSFTPTARDYVQDGLIAMWDGIENAGWGTHNSSATIWKDLVSLYDLTLGESGISFGDDCIVLDGGRATRTRQPSWVSEKIMQVEIVSSHTKQGLLAQFGNNPSNRQVFVYPAGTFNMSQSSENCSMSVPSGSVHSVSATYQDSDSGEVASACLDGVSATLGSRKGNNGFGGMMIGGSTDTYMVIQGTIYSMRIYSRALSTSEIAANYSVDKARFNLS